MKLYKLTDHNGCTMHNTQWGEGVTHTASGEGELCSKGWLHAYTHPLLAVLLNPIHACIRNPHLWEAEGEIGKSDRELKVGTTKLTTIRRMDLPKITTEQKIRFAIGCAWQLYADAEWREWAQKWLSGEDRTYESAYKARYAAYAADAYAAAYAANAAALNLITIAEWAITDSTEVPNARI